MNVYAPEAADFYHKGMEQLGNRVLGEEAAKVGVLVAYVTGLNLALVGEPGGGKTTLASDAHRLIEGIADENVARVPHHSDLTPQQLIGGSVTTTKETREGDKVRSETLSAKIEPIIHQDTQVIWLDELNRVNPFAVNGVLGALESGKITTDAGEVPLKGLELAISTMNPTETRQATFPVAAATASRHAIGVVMGNKADPRRVDLIDALMDGVWQPSGIHSVTTVEGLHALRDKAARVPLPTSLKGRARELVTGTVDALGDHHLHEAVPRITKHIASIARGLALLHSSDVINEAGLNEATRYVLTARLGIMGVRGSNQNLYQAVDDVVRGVTG
jgi:MoxR-like ATPase